MKAFVLQMTSTPDVNENLTFVANELEKANAVNSIAGSMVVLPECFARFGGKDVSNLEIAESLLEKNSTEESTVNVIQQRLSELAKKFGVYLVGGSIPTKTLPTKTLPTAAKQKFMATCPVYGPNGERMADYQKIHLFDVTVADNTGSYRESESTEPGSKIVCFDTEWGKIGVAICYDLRFPGLFQALRKQGVKAIVLPSAFTERTGEAHWLALIQARAIENQVYMLASNQNGIHQNGRQTYGHSVIVSPWGNVLVDAKRENGMFGIELDLTLLNKIRQDMPVVEHNKFSVTFQK